MGEDIAAEEIAGDILKFRVEGIFGKKLSPKPIPVVFFCFFCPFYVDVFLSQIV